jgi:hypothetical protein
MNYTQHNDAVSSNLIDDAVAPEQLLAIVNSQFGCFGNQRVGSRHRLQACD